MKQLLIPFFLALLVAAPQAQAFGMDMSSLTPVLTFPEPAPEPVTRDKSGIDQ